MRAEHQLDDRLFPVHQGQVIQGTYRGRKKRIFTYSSPGACLQRKLVSANGWHRVVIIEDGIETYRSPASRDRKAIMSLLGRVPLHSVREG